MLPTLRMFSVWHAAPPSTKSCNALQSTQSVKGTESSQLGELQSVAKTPQCFHTTESAKPIYL